MFCELHFDEEGLGFVVSDLPDVEPLILEDAFRFRYSGPSGELLIGGAAGPQVVNLDEFKGKYVAMSLKLHLGCSHSLKEFDAVEFRWIRCPAAKVMWCCKASTATWGLHSSMESPGGGYPDHGGDGSL